MDQLSLGGFAYNITNGLQIAGRLDVAANAIATRVDPPEARG
jgi:hypothetical protein